MPFSLFWGRVPLLKYTTEKNGVLILSSLLEGLVLVLASGHVAGRATRAGRGLQPDAGQCRAKGTGGAGEACAADDKRVPAPRQDGGSIGGSGSGGVVEKWILFRETN